MITIFSRLLVGLSLLSFPLFATLKQRMEGTKPGDYIVTESNKMISLVAIRSNTPTSLILEEITLPSKKRPASWSTWIRNRAPGHTSWSMLEIDLETDQLLECYSFSRATWLQISQQNCLISTLLQLPLKPIAPEKRRKIGPPPQPGESDFRKIWNPPLIVEGKKIDRAFFDVFEALWPEDGSEMAKKQVYLYFDTKKITPFPCWIEVETSHVSASMRVIDSGRRLPTIHRGIPRRVPEFIGCGKKNDTGVKLKLKSPKYFKQFELFAIDVTGKEKQIIPIHHSLVRNNDEILTLYIEAEELEQVLQQQHRYTWLLIPVGHSELYTESTKPFTWSL